MEGAGAGWVGVGDVDFRRKRKLVVTAASMEKRSETTRRVGGGWRKGGAGGDRPGGKPAEKQEEGGGRRWAKGGRRGGGGEKGREAGVLDRPGVEARARLKYTYFGSLYIGARRMRVSGGGQTQRAPGPAKGRRMHSSRSVVPLGT